MKLKKSNMSGDWFTTNGDWKCIGIHKTTVSRFADTAIRKDEIVRAKDDKRCYTHPDWKEDK